MAGEARDTKRGERLYGLLFSESIIKMGLDYVSARLFIFFCASARIPLSFGHIGGPNAIVLAYNPRMTSGVCQGLVDYTDN